MKIGLPSELGNGESRVSITHKGVEKLTQLGHEVFVSKGAGEASGITDEMYKKSGAILLDEIKDVYKQSDCIVKVKPPVSIEFDYLKTGQLLFCFILLEKNEALTRMLLEKKIIGIAYEMVIDKQGKKPLLIPMSEIAGKMAVFMGSKLMQTVHGGKGVMLGAVPGLAPSEVVILGAGSVAYGAAEIAMGIGCNVTILNRSTNKLRDLKNKLHKKGNYINLSDEALSYAMLKADLLVNTIDQMGDKQKHIVTAQMVRQMKKGSIIIDVACDEGGTIETSKLTSHTQPTYTIDGVVHCGIPNLPGIVPVTATFSLAEAVLPYIITIADDGFKKAILNDIGLRKALCTYDGYLIHKQASQNFDIPYASFEKAF
ncbi:alanine dehydrogenase [Marinisporobacter balticus]|uniref:alanine dehydrogenase n=1 Tax=Marinisporobacter balticus TaxID=2018667 RepID=A0A4R2L602_9FIRM|nr:alanine dehydrogenase [Marinisporobacter balticus]TCO79366.1 L-alanine dehydrogenase [Marinisporobacter balticus]